MSEFLPGAPAPADSIPASAPESGAPGAALDTSAEQTYEVKINGQVEKVPLKELLSGYSRHQDYTRKTQQLSQREQEIQGRVAQYEQAFQEIHGFLNDRQKVAAYLQSLGAQAQSDDPNEIVTGQDLQAHLARVQEQNSLQMQQQLQMMEQRMQVQNLTGEYSKQIDGKLQGILSQYPDLKGIRGIERQLRFEVAQRQPQSLEDALQAFDEAAEAISSDLTNVIKMKATASSPLNNGIEPRGGQGPMPAGQPNFKSVKDTRLRDLVIQDMMKAGGS